MRIVLVVVGALAIAAALVGYRCVHVSLEAERTLHAYYEVLDLLGRYVQENHAWPKSWDDLAVIPLKRDDSARPWPSDRAEIQKRIYVDVTVHAPGSSDGAV